MPAGGAEHRTPPGALPSGRQRLTATARRRSEETLAALGKETALDTANRVGGADADRLREWVNRDHAQLMALLRSLPPSKGGHGRELRVGMCGVAFVARRGEAVNFARRCCKDRLCPDCSARRSRRFAAALREQIARRTWAAGCCFAECGQANVERGEQAAERGEVASGCAAECRNGNRGRTAREAGRCEPERSDATRVLFVTLTQRKRSRESPKAALDRLLAAFRRFRRCAFFRAHVVGGVRSLEVTARRAGDIVGGYEVKIPGTHAHLHCLIEVRAGVRPSEIAAAWCAGADAEAAGVDVQECTEDNIYQVAKYPLDMSGMLDVLTAAPDYVRQVVTALHGRRLVEAFGSWKSWDLGLREPKGTLVYGDRAVYTIASTDPDNADTFRWGDGRVEPTDDVLRALLESDARPLSGIGSRAGTDGTDAS